MFIRQHSILSVSMSTVVAVLVAYKAVEYATRVYREAADSSKLHKCFKDIFASFFFLIFSFCYICTLEIV